MGLHTYLCCLTNRITWKMSCIAMVTPLRSLPSQTHRSSRQYVWGLSQVWHHRGLWSPLHGAEQRGETPLPQELGWWTSCHTELQGEKESKDWIKSGHFPFLSCNSFPFIPLSLSFVNATQVNEVCSILRSKAHYPLHITDKTHSLSVPSLKSFSIHALQPALRYCIISSGQKGPWHLRSPTSRILTILRSWDAIFPRRVYGQWADPGADGCGSYHLVTPIRITCNATKISGWECGWWCSLVPRPAQNGKVGFRD